MGAGEERAEENEPWGLGCEGKEARRAAALRQSRGPLLDVCWGPCAPRAVGVYVWGVRVCGTELVCHCFVA